MVESNPSESLARIVDAYWAHRQRVHPTSAHLRGDYRQAAEFEHADRVSEDADIEALRAYAAEASALPDDGLDESERVTRDVLVATATAGADLTESRLAEIAVDPIFGSQVTVPLVMGMLALPTEEVAWALPDKLRGIARAWGEEADRLAEGIDAGRAPAEFACRGVLEQLDAQLAGDPADSPVLQRVPAPPEGVDADAWRSALREVVAEDLFPAMASYRDRLRDEVLPHARPDEQCGLGAVPGGEEAYAAALRYFTTTTKSAQEIHDLGRATVEALADEYRALGPEVAGSEDLETIFAAMRSDPALHFDDPDAMVAAAEKAMARAWDAMPGWFETLPQARCAVEPTMSGPKAFYFPPAADGSRGGTFYINVDDVSSWGTFELESMAFHEGIPGHHLQLTIASELTGVPEFRKHEHNSAYAEGWGLYTERLSDEMGLYTSAVDRIGMVAADSMRACRLVVDTGLHALGWSREQAVQYMLDNSPLHEGVVRPEVDRYVVTPGQACSYLVGRVEIQRMRREAEERLGERFDVKAFHSAVLDQGSLPLQVLDDVVRRRLA